MVQSTVLPGVQGEGGIPRKNGQITPEGRAHQIDSRLNHGIRSRSPILLHVESEREWQAHLEGYRTAYSPQGLVEENLVLMVAYQDWKLLRRMSMMKGSRWKIVTGPRQKSGSNSQTRVNTRSECGWIAVISPGRSKACTIRAGLKGSGRRIWV
jgi:hypothetical protein